MDSVHNVLLSFAIPSTPVAAATAAAIAPATVVSSWPYSVPSSSISSISSPATTALASPTTTSYSSSSSYTPSTSASANSDRDPTGVIVGSVLGSVAACLIIILAALILARNRRRKRTPPSAEFLVPRHTSLFHAISPGHDDALPAYDNGAYQYNPFYEKQRTDSA